MFSRVKRLRVLRAAVQQPASMPLRSSKSTQGSFMSGTMYAPTRMMLLDAPDLALDFLLNRVEHPYSGHTPPEWVMFLPAFDPIRCTPRCKALVLARRTTDPRAASACRTKRNGLHAWLFVPPGNPVRRRGRGRRIGAGELAFTCGQSHRGDRGQMIAKSNGRVVELRKGTLDRGVHRTGLDDDGPWLAHAKALHTRILDEPVDLVKDH